jgi:anti-sigma factor RsiW
MPEHLTKEQISALLDDPQGVVEDAEHLAGCAECAREFEQMSRMRMALSGLTDLEPPAGEWEAVQERLGLQPAAQAGTAPVWRRTLSWPLQAAAVIALFAGGLMVGQRIGSGPEAGDVPPTVAASDGLTAPGAAGAIAAPESALEIEPTDAYLRSVADLQHLRDRHAEALPRTASPEAYAERITHLDAMIDASRDALREAPADPVLNNFLFQLVDERENLAGQLDQTLRMTAAEY